MKTALERARLRRDITVGQRWRLRTGDGGPPTEESHSHESVKHEEGRLQTKVLASILRSFQRCPKNTNRLVQITLHIYLVPFAVLAGRSS